MKKLKHRIKEQCFRVNSELYASRKKLARSTVSDVVWQRAVNDSANFVEENLGKALLFDNRKSLWKYCAQKVLGDYRTGKCFEFGVAGGASINFLSALMPDFLFLGFDSFLGLKEDWIGHHETQGAFSQSGRPPKVNENVKLQSGWFEVSLPAFINRNGLDELRFIHVDCDTYESTKTVLDALAPHLVRGTYILFDEFLGYPNWRNGEFKAFAEAKKEFDLTVEYRAFGNCQALVQLI